MMRNNGYLLVATIYPPGCPSNFFFTESIIIYQEILSSFRMSWKVDCNLI